MRYFWQESLQREYVSELDQFLSSFDKKPEASSVSRRSEEASYAKLNRLRDHSEEVKLTLYDEF